MTMMIIEEKRHSTSSYSSFNKRNTTTSKSFITKKKSTLININLLQEVAIAKAIVDLVEVDKLLTSYNGIMLDL